MVKICGNESSLDLTDDEVNELEKLTRKNSVEDLEMLFSLAIENAENVHKSSFQELSLESMVIKLATTRNSIPINEILGKITSLAKKISSQPAVVEDTKQPVVNIVPERKKELTTEQKTTKVLKESPPPVEEEMYYEPQIPVKPDTADTPGINRSESFVEFVRQQNAILGLHLKKAISISEEKSDLRILFNENNINFEYLHRKNSVVSLKSHANEYYGKELNIRINFNIQEEKISKDNPGKPSIKDGNAVKDALSIFDGTILKTKAVKKE